MPAFSCPNGQLVFICLKTKNSRLFNKYIKTPKGLSVDKNISLFVIRLVRLMKLLNHYLLSSTLVITALCSLNAAAQGTDTLDKIRKTHTILVGARENGAPFSSYQANGTATGYSIDLCSKVVAQLRKELKTDDLKVQYVPVTAANRLAKLKSGDIDIECGQTVITRARMNEVDFSNSTFVAGERVLVRANSNYSELDSLKDRPVAVVKGTTAEKLVAQMRDERFSGLKIMSFDNNTQAFKALEAGTVDGFVQLDVTLEALRAKSANPAALRLSKTSMSIEPIGIAVRKNDTALLATIDKSLASVYASSEIASIYDKWFASADLTWPMPRLLRENLNRPSKEPGVALALGHAL